MIEFQDLVGKRFGRIVVLGYDSTRISIVGNKKRKIKRYFYKCKCDCGNIKVINRSSLIGGKTKSCGCLRNEVAKIGMAKHGLSDSRLQRILNGMKQRCYNKKNTHYNCYGGRGITICNDWKNSVKSFYNWAIQNGYKDNLTIDRIDVNGNYCPENCRWVTQKEQCRNQRRNVKYTFNGKKLCLTEISEICGIKTSILLARLNAGLSMKNATTKKVKKCFKILYDGKEYNLYGICKKLGLSYKSIHTRYKKGKKLVEMIGKDICVLQEP